MVPTRCRSFRTGVAAFVASIEVFATCHTWAPRQTLTWVGGVLHGSTAVMMVGVRVSSTRMTYCSFPGERRVTVTVADVAIESEISGLK